MLHLSKSVIKGFLILAFTLTFLGSVSAQNNIEGMVFIKGGKFRYLQQNRWREGLELNKYEEGPIGDAYVEDYMIDLKDFYIDKTEVTNIQFKKFIDESGYQPKHASNFLKHWKDNTYPDGEKNYPVVYVDYWDAKAYAEWAGKELPTEEQWQLAAQGYDGRLFPWGDKWDSTKANVGTSGAKPVGSFPEGASPFGVLDMTGNIAEMTASFHDDGMHWFSYLRGGSWFQSFHSLWYTENGLLTNNQRLKFWWLNPGYNRSVAIGFRCVKNIVEN